MSARTCKHCGVRLLWARMGAVRGEPSPPVAFEKEAEPPSDDPALWVDRWAPDDDGVMWPYAGDHAFAELPRHRFHQPFCPVDGIWGSGYRK